MSNRYCARRHIIGPEKVRHVFTHLKELSLFNTLSVKNCHREERFRWRICWPLVEILSYFSPWPFNDPLDFPAIPAELEMVPIIDSDISYLVNWLPCPTSTPAEVSLFLSPVFSHPLTKDWARPVSLLAGRDRPGATDHRLPVTSGTEARGVV